MSSDGTQPPENGCASLEDLKTRKSLKSSVISDCDSLKIKLKISKRDIGDLGRGKKEDGKGGKSSELRNGEEKARKEEEIGGEGGSAEEKPGRLASAADPKMKLRSKREAEGESEDSEGVPEERKKRKEFPGERDGERSKRKRMRAEEGFRRRSRRYEELAPPQNPTDVLEEPLEINKESFCWTCHKDGSVVKCDTCPRVFHLKCVSLSKDPSKDWICPECSLVLHAEKMSTRSEAMKSLSLDQLCTLLSFAIDRMKNVPEAFWKPVDPREVPFYDKYITNPMDLNQLERNMKAKMYGSPQAFLADAKWLLHNSIIFNSTQSPLTSTARFLVKICRQEMAEIENCPDCYLNAHTKEDWFVEVCRKPHILIWARLKGFPFWPAKAMSTNLKTQQVDARFFGAHDKAWVPVKECFLYSKNSPQLLSKKRTDLDEAFLEVEGYIRKIRQKYGSFCYAPDKTPFLPELYDKQLQSLIPNYREEKPPKKKRKGEQVAAPEEGPPAEAPVQNGRKVGGVEGGRVKTKRHLPEDASKVDVCTVNDYVSEEKVAGEDLVSPEDEIARSLEMFDTHEKVEGEAVDENSTDVDGDESLPIPEHGYSRALEASQVVQSSSGLGREETGEESVRKEVRVGEGEGEGEAEAEAEAEAEVEVEAEAEAEAEAGVDLVERECVAESSERGGPGEEEKEDKEEEPEREAQGNDQCEVSSTSADLKEGECRDEEEEAGGEQLREEDSEAKSRAPCVSPLPEEPAKKDGEKSPKSFGNLSCDQKQKILTEAKLLANIDEMTASGKQKVLNELGLDGSQVDIRQLARENRQILETINKKCQNEKKGFEEVSIKNEDFEQYLMEENSEEVFDEEPPPASPKLGSIKVRDFQTLSRGKGASPTVRGASEPMLKIMDVQSLRDLKPSKKEPKAKRKKSPDHPHPSRKLKLEPVIELIKLDGYDKSVEKLNRKLRLSDEVSLLMVDGEKKVDVEGGERKKGGGKGRRPPRARKTMPNRARPGLEDSAPKNVSVISVDTENSAAQKNLLKSLCLEEKKSEDSGMKTVLITTNEKGIKNVDVKTSSEAGGKKGAKEVTIEALKDQKGSDGAKEGAGPPQKNLAVVANSHLIVTNSGPALVANQTPQSNLALTQNNLGQLSLVHLSNLTSGIQTNFINLTNETIGFNSGIGTLYASPGFNGEFPASSVILTPSPGTAPVNAVAKGSKGGGGGGDTPKVPISRLGPGKPGAGISVKSPASLGLVASQPEKLPPLIAIPGDWPPPGGEVGPFTAELNKHSIKMAEYMRATIEDILRELSSQGSLEAKYKLLTIEMEKLQWRHQQEIMELKHHSERSMMELRNSLETEKQKCLGELKAQLESQHQKVISETKRKQWCANCGKEALFYCCWNTSYCDYPCQQQHWPGHMSTCAQLGNNLSIGTSQLQGKTPGMKYHNSSYVPVMSRGSGGGAGGGVFATNRAVSNVQAGAGQARRSSDPAAPQLPVNITIRPQQQQQYFM